MKSKRSAQPLVSIPGVGWARKSRHYVEGKQVTQLEAANCRRIYRASEATIHDLIRSLRAEAPEPVRVTTLARLAPTREQLRDVIDQIHSRNCWVEELATGRSTKDAKQAVSMALDAATEQGKDARAPTRKQAQRAARLSHDVHRANREASRLPRDKAREIWHNHPHWTNDECLAEMPGWTEGTAYRQLGRRQLAKGRPVIRKVTRT